MEEEPLFSYAFVESEVRYKQHIRPSQVFSTQLHVFLYGTVNLNKLFF